MIKRLFLFIVLFTIYNNNVESQESFHSSSDFSTQKAAYFLHTVESGQTVYGISVMYNVTTEAIYQLNPESRNGIKTGEILKIPQKSQQIVYHTIQPKETLYSVSKKYNISGEDIIVSNPGLSVQTFTIGKTILIPIYKEISVGPNGKMAADESESKVNALLQQLPDKQNVSLINVALLLPFGTVDKDSTSTTSCQRFIEYYEGFLLSLDSLKKTGHSISVNVYDIGFKIHSLEKVLKKDELKESHLIIGGFSEDQINKISKFSKENAIRYVIPFASKTDETMTNPFIFQSNPTQSYLYSKVSLAFAKKYKNYNIVFVDMGSQNDKADLIKTLQSDLSANKQAFQTLTYNGYSFTADFRNALSSSDPSIIVISSGTSESLARIIAPLRTFKESGFSKDISLFGYPEWQTYVKDYLDDFFSAHACLYSIFYANNTQPEVKAFFRLYRSWYGKTMINSYPRYGMLGYDTGMYFLQMISRYGINFENSLGKFQYKSLQTGYNFNRVNNWGGFINTNVYWIDFLPDYTIKREIAK